MAYDYAKLDGRITEVYGTRRAFAVALGLSEHSLSVKMSSKIAWKQSEIRRACDLLKIPVEQIGAYFFNLKVQSA